MHIRIYLHDYVADSLKCFGDLNDTVNKIIDAGINGHFDIERLPACPKGAEGKYDFDITNSEFIEQRMIRGATSTQLSLRRILYWFVDNEAWDLIGLTKENDYIPKKKLKYIQRTSNISGELIKLSREVPAELKHHVLTASKAILEVLNAIR